MREIKKLPIEIFGHDVESDTDSAITARKQQYCKYLKASCNKPRKSEPHLKVGICSLGASVKGGKKHPVIICPQRFKEEVMFDTIIQKYLTTWDSVKWVQEVNIGVGGSIDFVAVEVDSHDVVKDFLCVEIQAAGTTGTPYPYVKELLTDGHFSGKRYYEFDLSGEWTPANRYQNQTIVSPGRQSVIFASHPGTTILVSDTELNSAENVVTASGYSFKPNYMTTELAEASAYLLNADGSSFDKNTAAATAVPFRPYFTASVSGTRTVGQIIFGNDESELEAEEEHGDPTEGELNGGLRVWTKKGRIFVESSLSFTEDLRIVTPAGITVAAFAVKAGETVTVQADFSGMYVVYTLDGRYIKKLSVKK